MSAILEQHYRVKDVQKIFGISQSSVYEYISRNILPKPLKLGRTSVFLKSEIDEVIEKMKATRDGEVA